MKLLVGHSTSSSSSMQLLNLGGNGSKENTNKLNKWSSHTLMNCLQEVVLFSGLLYFLQVSRRTSYLTTLLQLGLQRNWSPKGVQPRLGAVESS
jgi:hypothetical protein